MEQEGKSSMSENALSAELFPLTLKPINDRQVETAAGRDIHAFLNISREYATWVRAQIKRLQLVENRDFVVFPLEVRKPQSQGGRPALEYHFTQNATQHIGMASGSVKGHEIREWFIARDQQLAVIEKATASWDLLAQMVENGRRQARQIETLEQADQRRAAQQMVQQQEIIAMQAQQIEALKLSQGADAKAEQAMHGQAWMTIHQFVTIHELARQMPQSFQQEYARYLIGYCAENNLRIYPQPVAYQRWQDENAYYVEAIRDTLPYWLNRRNGQIELRAV